MMRGILIHVFAGIFVGVSLGLSGLSFPVCSIIILCLGLIALTIAHKRFEQATNRLIACQANIILKLSAEIKGKDDASPA